MKDIHFLPYGREHDHLTRVKSGDKHISIVMEKVANFVGSDSDPKSIADDIYDCELSTQGAFTGLVEVQEPVNPDGTWVVQKVLTEKGQEVIAALESGILWNQKQGFADIPATERHYDAMLESGEIDTRFLELVGSSSDERLKDLRGRMGYFKMRGDRQGDIVSAPEVKARRAR